MYSLTIKKILDKLEYPVLEELKNIHTGKIGFIYKRNDDLNFLLAMLKVNKDLNIFKDNETVIDHFKMKKPLPNTKINDYLSVLKYMSKDFNIYNHLDKKYL